LRKTPRKKFLKEPARTGLIAHYRGKIKSTVAGGKYRRAAVYFPFGGFRKDTA